MTKKMIAEGIEFVDVLEIVTPLIQDGHKILIDPFNGKYWIFDYGIPRK
jgi:hypothetical protein